MPVTPFGFLANDRGPSISFGTIAKTAFGSGPNRRTVAISGLPEKARWRAILLLRPPERLHWLSL